MCSCGYKAKCAVLTPYSSLTSLLPLLVTDNRTNGILIFHGAFILYSAGDTVNDVPWSAAYSVALTTPW